eukprot:5038210-Pyramimonas_sp.AAC.2
MKVDEGTGGRMAARLSGSATKTRYRLRCDGLAIASACQCGHHTLRRDLANAIVVLVGHYNIAAPVHCHTPGAGKLRGVALSISIASLASARQCGHQALRRDLANTLVLCFCHNDVALPIHCHSIRTVELSGGALSVSMAFPTSSR